MKKISFIFRHYLVNTILIQKIIKVFRTIIYIFSELEVEIQTPGQYTPLRYLYLKLLKVKFGQKSFFSRGLIIYNGHQIEIGKGASIGERSMLHAHGNIIIGDDFLAAPGLTINSGGHNVKDLHPFGEEIRIGDRVWCGVNVTILAGVQIGDDVVIGACSVVTRNIPANSVIVGAPARVIDTLSRRDVNVWKWYQNK